MSIAKEEIYKNALSLPPIEKAKLVEVILSSFNFKSRKEIDDSWKKEADSRYEAIKSGDIKLISAKDVFNSIN